jgi:hypothetical protein
MGPEKPALLIGPDRVVLNCRGVEICRVALALALKHSNHANGGAYGSDDVAWLCEVLRLASTSPAESAAAGRPVVVNITDRQEHGSADGSAVAVDGSAGSASVVGMGSPLVRALDTHAAADLLGVSDRAVRKACSRGTLRAAWVSGHWEIDRADALAYGERRKVGTNGRQAAAP